MESLIINIKSCARCGYDHSRVEFKELHNPIDLNDGEPLTHWALCPFNGEPILAQRIQEVMTPTNDEGSVNEK